MSSPHPVSSVSTSEILRKSGIALFLGSVLLGTARKSEAATLTVTNNADAGAGSLRDTVIMANPGDTITFAPTVTSPIVLTTGQIGLDKAVTITGPGASALTISGNNTSRIFFANDGAMAAAPITISGLTLTNGRPPAGDGGAILMTENLTLRDCVISNCTSTTDGGGLYANAQSTVTVSGCTFTGNSAAYGGGLIVTGNSTITDTVISGNTTTGFGGGLFASGTAVMTNLTVTGNTAGTAGGGLYSNGTITIRNCTFSGNTSVGRGAGVYFDGGTLLMENTTVSGNTVTGANNGGGVWLDGGAKTVRQCTISGNRIMNAAGVGAGVYIRDQGGGTTTIQNCTIAFNTAAGTGGGAAEGMYTTPTFQSTIISNNTAAANPDLNGTFNMGNCLIQTPGTATINTVGGPNITGQNPLLAPLANNGGTTQTHALTTGSPAESAGSNPASLTTDQRGAARVAGSAIDIGAVERNVTAPTATLTAAPAVDTTSNPTQYDFTITFSDDFAVNGASIDNADVQVTGPNGFTQLAQLVSVTPAGNGTPRVAVYRITPPGGTWDAADAGVYTVTLLASQVSDVDGNFAAGASLGTFAVNTLTTVKQGEVDSDGDGFTDELEAALGTNAFSAASTPFANNAFAGPGRDFKLNPKALSITLKFGDRDTIRAQGSFPIPAGVRLPGNTIVFDVGGVIYPFILDRNGSGVNETTNSRATLRTRFGGQRAPQNVQYLMNIRGEDLETKFADEGLTADLVKEKQVNVVVKILFNNTYYRESIPLLYTKTAARGKTDAPRRR